MNRILFQDPGNLGPSMPHRSLIGTIAGIAATVVTGNPMIGAAVSGGLGLIGNKKQKVDPGIAEAQNQQKALLAQQQAVQARSQNQANDQTTTLDKQLSGIQAAALARRRGTGGAAYSGPQKSLKSTLGG